MTTKFRAVVLAILPAAALVATMAVGAGTAAADPHPDPVLTLYPDYNGQGLGQEVYPDPGCVNVDPVAWTRSAANWSDDQAVLFYSSYCQDDPVATVDPHHALNLDHRTRIASVLFVERDN